MRRLEDAKTEMDGHYSDEDLLRALDGELPRLRGYLVREHLRRCWRCRSRQAELEDQIRAVTRSICNATPTGPEWMAAQQERLRLSVEEWESTQVAAPARDAATPQPSRRYAFAFAFVVVTAASVWIWLQPKPASPEPRVVLLEAVSAEAPLLAGPLYQAFRVDYETSSDPRERTAGRLELWADPVSQRFASRWSAEGSETDYYALRTSGQDYVFDRRRGAPWFESRATSFAPVPLTGALRLATTTAELEDAFLEWLGGREWKALSLTAELARFVDQQGVQLDVRRIESGPGAGLLELSAERTIGSMVARMVVELDPGALEVRRQRVEVRTGERRIAIAFTPERSERFTLATLPSAPFDRALIEPELDSDGNARPFARPLQDRRIPSSAAPADPDQERTTARDAALRTLEVLHQENVCRSGTIVLQRDAADWAFSVVVTSDDQARALRARLSGIGTAEVRHRVLSAQEAVQELSLAAGSLGSAATQSPSAPNESRELAIEEPLRRHFAGLGGVQSISARIDALSRDAVQLSQRLLGETQAIENILMIASDRQSQADPRVQRMLSDHGAALTVNIRDLNALLRPALLSVAPAATETLRTPSGEWHELNDCIWKVDQLVHVLLAGADDRAWRTTASGSGRGWEEEATSQLLQGLDEAAAGAVRWLAGLKE